MYLLIWYFWVKIFLIVILAQISCIFIWICLSMVCIWILNSNTNWDSILSFNISDLKLTASNCSLVQPEGTATWEISAYHHKARFECWFIYKGTGWAVRSGAQGSWNYPGAKNPRGDRNKQKCHSPASTTSKHSNMRAKDHQMNGQAPRKEARTMLSDKWWYESTLTKESNWLSRVVRRAPHGSWDEPPTFFYSCIPNMLKHKPLFMGIRENNICFQRE
jgi:hypothetical protein